MVMNKVIEEIKFYLEVYDRIIKNIKDNEIAECYSEGVYDGLLKALQIIEKKKG